MESKTTLALTYREELANSLTHGLGLVFGLAAIPVLVAQAMAGGTMRGVIGAAVFGLGFLMVYTFSTLYHSISRPRLKHIMRVLDHISIYFLIAGSYTPFILTFVYNRTGLTLLAVLWGLTLVGTFFKVFFTGRFDFLSTMIYLAMGWMLLAAARTFFTSLPESCLVMIIAGGILYSSGVVFYLWERLKFNHAIWHLFVLAASICHYTAVLFAVTG